MRKLTQSIASVLLLAVPLVATAAGILQADPSIAGIGLDVTLTGAKASTSVDISVESPDGKKQLYPVVTNAQGAATASIPGRTAEVAGTYSIGALSDRSPIAETISVEVRPETMDPWTSTINVSNPYILANGHDSADITVTLRDRFGNVLAGRPVALVSSRSSDSITSLNTQTNAEGMQHFSLTAEEGGTANLRALDLLSGNTLIEGAEVRVESKSMGGNGNQFYPSASPSNSYTASTSNGRFYYGQVTSGFDIIAGFEVTAPATMQSGIEAPKITVRAVDRDGNTIENYTGTVQFSSTDPDAILPNFGTYTFKDRDLGMKEFALALEFRTNGPQTLRVEDSNDPSIVGETDVMVSGGTSSGNSSMRITSHKNGDMVNTLDILVEGIGPKFANIIVMGGEQDVNGATDDEGNFSIPITLSANQRDFTLRVRDDVGRNDSGPVHLILDQDNPVINGVTFSPETPEPGEKVLAVVESEPSMGQVIMSIPTTDIADLSLIENPTQSGSYQVFFTAPESGYYQPVITVMDKAGNIADIQATFTVGAGTLAQVQNVRAQSRVEAVELEWDPIEGNVDGYRIYIGDTPTDYLYTLDTERDVTKAVVRGLNPGQLYYFAVTAVSGGAESEEKSEAVSAQVLGLALEVSPEDGALNVKWTSLSTGLPLSTFILEYGVDEESLTESRTLNGELRNYTIRDLLNGITYHVRLTPVTVTGDKLEELASKGQGTPNGKGFKPGARDDVPFDIPLHSGAPNSPAPTTPSTGVPSAVWFVALAMAAAGVFYRVHRRKSIASTQAFLQAVQSQYRR